jgi:hypothetical protein
MINATRDKRLQHARGALDEACRAIDGYLEEALRLRLRKAFQALVSGDEAERDRLLSTDEIDALRAAARNLKREACLRAAESVGISRAKMEQKVRLLDQRTSQPGERL